MLAGARRLYIDVVVDDLSPYRWIRARISGLFFLGFLGVPVSTIVHSDRPAPDKVLILALVASYASCFAAVIWRNTPRMHERRATYAVLASLVLGAPLIVLFGHGWLAAMSYFTTAMLLFNFGIRWWPYIVVGIPFTEVAIGRYALGDNSSRPLTTALQVLLIGAIQAAFYQQVAAKIELRRVRADLARLAVSEERLRISRDLHDILGQELSALSLKAELAARLATRDAERAAAEMVEVAAVARAALADVRETVSGYRKMSLCGETDTARALLTAAGIKTDIDIQELPAPLDSCSAWLIREAVTNVIRHAGASRCQIRAVRTLTSVVIEVRDDGGTASAALSYGNGLTGLAERVRSESGELTCARDGAWFVLRATFDEAAVRSAAGRLAAQRGHTEPDPSIRAAPVTIAGPIANPAAGTVVGPGVGMAGGTG